MVEAGEPVRRQPIDAGRRSCRDRWGPALLAHTGRRRIQSTCSLIGVGPAKRGIVAGSGANGLQYPVRRGGFAKTTTGFQDAGEEIAHLVFEIVGRHARLGWV